MLMVTMLMSTLTRSSEAAPEQTNEHRSEPNMVLSKSVAKGLLARDDVTPIIAQAAAELNITGKRVLIIIPDGTRTMPMPLMFELLQQEIGARAAACDYLVALG